MYVVVWERVLVATNKASVELQSVEMDLPRSEILLSMALVFTARCYASAVLAMGLCPCPSVTSRSSTKTAKRRITQTTPHDTPGTLVF